MKERILVVEDVFEFVLYSFMGLEGLGEAKAVGEVNEGVKIVDEYVPTLALLDINIRGGNSIEIAKKLSEKNTPYVFVTSGNGNGVRILDKKGKELEVFDSMDKSPEIWKKAYKYAIELRENK